MPACVRVLRAHSTRPTCALDVVASSANCLQGIRLHVFALEHKFTAHVFMSEAHKKPWLVRCASSVRLHSISLRLGAWWVVKSAMFAGVCIDLLPCDDDGERVLRS